MRKRIGPSHVTTRCRNTLMSVVVDVLAKGGAVRPAGQSALGRSGTTTSPSVDASPSRRCTDFSSRREGTITSVPYPQQRADDP